VLAWAAGARQGRAADVNDYLRKASSEDITAKDFRTWAGIQLAAMALAQLAELDGEPPSNRRSFERSSKSRNTSATPPPYAENAISTLQSSRVISIERWCASLPSARASI
jgi:hypothetical protein